MATWYLGVDPGLGETGLCLVHESGITMAAATVRAAGPERPDLERYVLLARSVRGWVRAVYERLSAVNDSLVVCIETPVVTSTNIANYRKQASTVALIEYYLLRTLADALIEVNPTEVKMAATGHGNSVKAAIVAASPFHHKEQTPTVEALADAWAVALAGMLHKHRLKWPRMYGLYTVNEEIL